MPAWNGGGLREMARAAHLGRAALARTCAPAPVFESGTQRTLASSTGEHHLDLMEQPVQSGRISMKALPENMQPCLYRAQGGGQ